MRKATGNHLVKTTSLEKPRVLSLVSATLEIEYAMQYTYGYTSLIHIPILKPIGEENSEHCLWFLLLSKSSIICSIPIVLLYLYIYPYSDLLMICATQWFVVIGSLLIYSWNNQFIVSFIDLLIYSKTI